MELTRSDFYGAPASASFTKVVAATKPIGAKGTGKTSATAKHPVAKTASKKKPAVMVKHTPPPEPPKVKKPKHELSFTAMGPGRAVGISCNGKEIFAEIVFQESLSLGDSCIRVDGRPIHKYKSGDKLAMGSLTAQGLMNLH